jgi:hypothetical protein
MGGVEAHVVPGYVFLSISVTALIDNYILQQKTSDKDSYPSSVTTT